jgi:ABC-2 type transport system ATP-binding protein
VVREPDRVRLSIGLSGQFAAVDDRLTGRENLRMIGELYGLRSRAARQRADELLARFDLTAAGNRRSSTYSGGMRRRLDLAGAIVVRPSVMFLDEPSVGLDPASRLMLWDTIEDLVAQGTTLLLTTQYLEEADRLARDIAVVDHGRIVARGTPRELKAKAGGQRVEVVVAVNDDLAATAGVLARFGTRAPEVDRPRNTISVPVAGGLDLLTEVIAALAAAGIELTDLALRRPSLDEVFLDLTEDLPQDIPQDIERTAVGVGAPGEKE